MMVADFALRPATTVPMDLSSPGSSTSGEQTPVGHGCRCVTRSDHL